MKLDIFLDIADAPRLVGTAFFTRSHTGLSSTFIYDRGYLTSGLPSIDPALPLVSGPQYHSGLIRCFADTAPDCWGRLLINKMERLRAADEGKTPRHLDDLDYLLGVSDYTRQGALRFALTAPAGSSFSRATGAQSLTTRPTNGRSATRTTASTTTVPPIHSTDGTSPFLGEHTEVPKLVALPALLNASDDIATGEDTPTAIKQLLNTGTTGLGGARPKAAVQLDDGALAIAKFPHHSDEWDVVAWEAAVLDMMHAAGMSVAEHHIARIGGRCVHILQRFDRRGGRRIPYMSAMTALQSNDGEAADYLDIAAAIRNVSSCVSQDLAELFDRVVFSVLVGNTDDHLRNHGFIGVGVRADKGSFSGWKLSPAFDVNPNPSLLARRSTGIAGADIFPEEADALVLLAGECNLSSAEAIERVRNLLKHVSLWETYAGRSGISRREINLFAPTLTRRIDAVAAAFGMRDSSSTGVHF